MAIRSPVKKLAWVNMLCPLVAPMKVAEDDAVIVGFVIVPLVGPLLCVRAGDASLTAGMLLKPYAAVRDGEEVVDTLLAGTTDPVAVTEADHTLDVAPVAEIETLLLGIVSRGLERDEVVATSGVDNVGLVASELKGLVGLEPSMIVDVEAEDPA